MDIPALSMAMAQSELMNNVGVAMLGKTLDLADTAGENFEAMLEGAALEQMVTPHLGGNIDVLL